MNESLLRTIDSIDDIIEESEMNVCAALFDEYQKMFLLLEYADEDVCEEMTIFQEAAAKNEKSDDKTSSKKEGVIMNSNTIIVNNIKTWLQGNQKSQQWLAQEIGVSKALVGHMLNESRVIQPQRIVAIAKALGVSVNELTTDASMREERMTVELRGKLSNRRSQMELERLKFAIEDYVGLKGDL